ncbi:MAG: HEAT repeat domain-containing protein [Myxococcales bacterium]|nr:HEAT repeat domain-containing protein [Myxococcales bacterium]
MTQSSRATRVSSDTAALLLEAARVHRARAHYGPGDSRLVSMFDRAFKLWRADLARHGELSVAIGRDGLRAEGCTPELQRELAKLHGALIDRGACELRFASDLEADAFAAFFEALVLGSDEIEREGGFAWSVYRRAPTGLLVNGVAQSDPPPLLPAPSAAASAEIPSAESSPRRTAAAAGPADGTSPGAEMSSLFNTLSEATRARFAPPPVPDEALLTDREESDTQPLVEEGRDVLSPEESDSRSFEPNEPVSPGRDPDDTQSHTENRCDVKSQPMGESATRPDLSAADALAREPLTAETPTPEPLETDGGPDALALETDELGEDDLALETDEPALLGGADEAAPSAPETAAQARNPKLGEEYDELFEQLGRADEDSYQEVLEAALYVLPRDRCEAPFDMALLLAGHVDEFRGTARSEHALRALHALGHDGGIEAWLERSLDDGGDPQGAWGRLLSAVRERAAPALLRDLIKQRDEERRAAGAKLLASLGEPTRDAVLAQLMNADPASLLATARLLREFPLPCPVGPLAKLLGHDQSAIREEAAGALSNRDDAEAVNALRGALLHGREDLRRQAAVALGRCRGPGVRETLSQALESCLANDDTGSAKEVIFALGKQGQAECAPILAELLKRKKRFGGRKLRELKLTAVGALAKIPGDAAAAALSRAAESRDAHLRRAAELALSRREAWLQDDSSEANEAPNGPA